MVTSFTNSTMSIEQSIFVVVTFTKKYLYLRKIMLKFIRKNSYEGLKYCKYTFLRNERFKSSQTSQNRQLDS